MNKAIHKRNDFIERSMMSALSFIKDATLYEEFASQKGFLQSLDPRMKTVSIFALLLTAVSLKSAGLIGALYVISLILAALSCIPVRQFLVRTWVFVPLFSSLYRHSDLVQSGLSRRAVLLFPCFWNSTCRYPPGIN